jgi:hypothetical protein
VGDAKYAITWAKLSPCQQFRYALIRVWRDSLPRLVFVMLNPSTADALKDDPTIRKCVGFARRLGFGGIEVVNLYAYRATSPSDLRKAGWPVGPDNHDQLTAMLVMAKNSGWTVCCAWGANARNRQEAYAFIGLAEWHGVPLFALRKSPDGMPHHPLMLPYTCQLEKL